MPFISDALCTMKVHRSSNANEFLGRSESWLLQSEAENNLILGIARQARDEPSGTDSENYWATVSEDGEVAGTVFRTPPYPLAISNLPREALPLIVDDVANIYADLTSVSGPDWVVENFADLWVSRFGGSWRVEMRQRIHALTVLKEMVQTPAGALRRMESSDAALILGWMEEFVREMGILGPGDRFARPYLEQRHFYLWDDNGPRSVAVVLRDLPNGACISAVYTPSVHRRKGYATAAVAALSAMLLSSGKHFCCLYTDLSNPASSSTYEKIGYEAVRDDAILVFEPS